MTCDACIMNTSLRTPGRSSSHDAGARVREPPVFMVFVPRFIYCTSDYCTNFLPIDERRAPSWKRVLGLTRGRAPSWPEFSSSFQRTKHRPVNPESMNSQTLKDAPTSAEGSCEMHTQRKRPARSLRLVRTGTPGTRRADHRAKGRM